MFKVNIEKATLENEDYRRVIYTNTGQQLVLMSIPVGQDIQLEVHPDVDQFFRFERGNGEVRVGPSKNNLRKMSVTDGDVVMVNRGMFHQVVNTGAVPLKLYTIYSPPEHPKNRKDKKRPPTILIL